MGIPENVKKNLRAEGEGNIRPTLTQAPPRQVNFDFPSSQSRIGSGLIRGRVSTETLRALDEQGKLFDESGQPQFPLTPEFIQEIGRRDFLSRTVGEKGLGSISRTGAGILIEGTQSLVPGEQQFEQLLEQERSSGAGFLESRRLAEEQVDLPSTNVPLLPFEVPLPGGRSFQNVDIGVKGFLENVVADPLNVLGAPLVTKPLSTGLRSTAKAGVRQATKGFDTVRSLAELDAAVEVAATGGAGAGQRIPLNKIAQNLFDTPSSQIDESIDSLGVSIADSRAAEGGKVPPRKPGTPMGNDMPPPRSPDVGLADDLDLPSWEKPTQGIMRKWEGARNAEGLAMEEWFSQGAASLKNLGIKEFNEETMLPLFRALHGEIPAEELSVPLRTLYADLRKLVLQEETDMLNFLGAVSDEGSSTLMAFDADNFAKRMMAHEDYFPRLWSPPPSQESLSGTTRSRLGATPRFAKPRVDASFSDLLAYMKSQDRGPATWNPYAMMARRRIAGVEYRESVKLVNRLKQRGAALPVNEMPDQGWRVPRVGPVFEGRPIPDSTVRNGVSYTQQIAVPNEVADFLENVFGRLPHVTGLKTIRQWSNMAKRLKLAASVFQHQDFAQRALGTAMTPTGISQGAPIKAIPFLGRLLEVTWIPGARNQLRRDLLSNKPIFKDGDFVITPKMVIEEGWSVQGDNTLINREFNAFLNDPSIVSGISNVAKPLRKAQEFWESGLFDGVYRESQRWSLENFIIPWIRRTRPDATARQVAAEAAESVNVMFSTLGNWQTVLKNPTIRELTRLVFFSANETESLMRSALRAGTNFGTGNQGGLMREWYLGLFISTAVIANIINLVATGKLLPTSSYNPVTINDPYAPFKVGYNGRFLAPQVPFMKGRNGQPVYVDLVGQMDTAFRWFLTPGDAAAARLNVVPRAAVNQASGKTFFGQPLDTPEKRAVQAVSDVGLPIAATQGLGAAREQFGLEEFVAEGESRLGTAGQIAQISGINLRGEPTKDMLDRVSQSQFGKSYDELPPFQTDSEGNTSFPKDEVRNQSSVADELELRRQTSISQGNRQSEYFKAIDDAIKGFDEDIGKRAEVFGISQEFREAFKEIQKAERERLTGIQESFPKIIEDLESRPNDPTTPEQAALAAYRLAVNDPELEDPDTGEFNYDRFQESIAQLERDYGEDKIRQAQEYVRRTDHPLVKKLRASRDLIGESGYWDAGDTAAEQIQANSIEEIPETRDAVNLWTQYQDLPTSIERESFAEDHIVIQAILKGQANLRAKILFENEDVERHLRAWGYLGLNVESGVNPRVSAQLKVMKNLQGGTITDPTPLLESDFDTMVESIDPSLLAGAAK